MLYYVYSNLLLGMKSEIIIMQSWKKESKGEVRRGERRNQGVVCADKMVLSQSNMSSLAVQWPWESRLY